MSDFLSDEYDRESREVKERVARYRAMPIRSIEALLSDGGVAVLDCGHWKPLLVRLREGDSVRCPDCFEAGMRKAQTMVQRVFHGDE